MSAICRASGSSWTPGRPGPTWLPSSGLGRALATTVVAEGGNVAICGRDPQRLAEAVAELEAAAVGDAAVLGVRADVTRPEELAALVDAAVQRWGRIDGLVNNAGAARAKRFEETVDEDWYDDLELKVHAAVRLTRLALPVLRRSGHASVVNVLNIGAKAPTPASSPTTASRAAGLAITKVLATELAPDGIRVNAICVGLVQSDQWERVAAATGNPVEHVHAELVAATGVPLGRVGRGDEFGDLGAFLLSRRSSYITGTAINLDGGASPVP